MVRHSTRAAAMRGRILRVFSAERRWLGFYSILWYARVRRRRERLDYRAAMAELVDRGELLMSFDADGGFWRFLWVGLIPAPIETSEVRHG